MRTFLSSIILSYVACPAVPYFPTLSYKRHVYQGKKVLNLQCVIWFSLQLLSETFLILGRNERHIIINVHRSSCKVGPAPYFCPILIALEYSRQIFEKSPNLYMPLRADLVNGSLYKIHMYYRGNKVKFYYQINNLVQKLFGRKSKFTWIPP